LVSIIPPETHVSPATKQHTIPSGYVTGDREERTFLYVMLADAKCFIKHVISVGNKRSTAALVGNEEMSVG
jgi:aspartyl/asparaginyl-tRNA synthetase